MIKFIKVALSIFVFIVVCLAVFYFATNESKPELKIETANEADELAHKMLRSINIEAWDSTHFVQWSFKSMHDYVWDKEGNNVQVKWNENEVRLNLDDRSQFIAFSNSEKINDSEQALELSIKAWEYFCNDSFWLNAPAKVFDSGTKRSIVIDEGKKALMVTYESGGATPGDSYLWFLDGNFMPYKYKMWVTIIPIGGTESTWANWQELPSGAMISTQHEMAVLKILIKNLKSGQSLEDLGLDKDLFRF